MQFYVDKEVAQKYKIPLRELRVLGKYLKIHKTPTGHLWCDEHCFKKLEDLLWK